jgi:hypothetical protein
MGRELGDMGASLDKTSAGRAAILLLYAMFVAVQIAVSA